MFKNLPKTVLCERETIRSCETPGGILTCLPSLLEKMERSKETKPFMSWLKKEKARREFDGRKKAKDSLAWIEERIKLMARSPLIKEESVQKTLKGATDALLFIDYPPTVSPIRFVYEAMKNAALTLAGAEERQVFEGWARFEGVLIMEFLLPNYLLKLLQAGDAIQEWREAKDSNPTVLYEFLGILSLYPTHEPLRGDRYIPPTNYEEAEKRYLQANIGFYLSLFSSEDSQVQPIPPEGLLKLIDAFLQFAQNHSVESKHGKTIRNSPDARDKAIAQCYGEKIWAEDVSQSRSIILQRVQDAISNKELKLEEIWEDSTFDGWLKEIDPAETLEEKLKRPKSKG